MRGGAQLFDGGVSTCVSTFLWRGAYIDAVTLTLSTTSWAGGTTAGSGRKFRGGLGPAARRGSCARAVNGTTPAPANMEGPIGDIPGS